MKSIRFYSEVLQSKRFAILELDHPSNLNALSFEILTEIKKAIHQVREDNYQGFIITSRHPHFCAGGDVKSLALTGSKQEAREYFELEYTVDQSIHELTTPTFAFLPGVCFGGGYGLISGVKNKIALKNFSWAMPEVKIGFFPDVAATYFLAHLPLGLRLYLTIGAITLNALDCQELGLVQNVWSAYDTNEALSRFRIDEIPIEKFRNDQFSFFYKNDFQGKSLNDFYVWTEKNQSFIPYYQQFKENCDYSSPFSKALTYELFSHHIKGLAGEALKQDYELAIKVSAYKDFKEGVRALLIDKDKKPTWSRPEDFNLQNFL